MNKINIYLSISIIKYLFLNLLIISILIIFLNIIEISRILDQNNSNVTTFLFLSLLKLPSIINEITIFIIIISIAFLYRNLISNNELISMRNIGYSIIDIYKPIGLTIFFFGLIIFLIINPLISISEIKYNQIINKKNDDIYSIKFIKTGMWIKNILNNDEKSYINIEEINLKNMEANEIKILNISDKLNEIIIAKKGTIKEKKFILENVSILNINNNEYDNKISYQIDINFNRSNIINAILNYRYIPFYKYNEHIKSLKKFDLYSGEVSLYYLSEIFKPIFLMIIGFVVMSFSSKFKRNENFFKVLFISVLIGFTLYLFKEIITNFTNKTKINFYYSYIVILTMPFLVGLYQTIKIEKN